MPLDNDFRKVDKKILAPGLVAEIEGKANIGHTHTESEVTNIGTHTHDGRYYTETEINTQMSLKANTSALSAHTGDTVVHVTQTEKDGWNSMQQGTLPVATSTVLGGVKQGSNVLIAADGVISVHAPESGTSITHNHNTSYAPISHSNDTAIHVTQANKDTWNAKAPTTDPNFQNSINVKGAVNVECATTTNKATLSYTEPYYGRLNYAVPALNTRSEVRFVSKGATNGSGETYFVVASSEANDTGNNLLMGVASGRTFLTNAVDYSTGGEVHLGGNSWSSPGVAVINNAGLTVNGTITATNLSGTNTGDQDLSGKADVVHTHTKANITDFSHTHTKANITDFPTIPTDTNQLVKSDVYTKTEVNSLISSSGNGDMLKGTYDTDGDGKVNAAVNADVVPWAGVSGKPNVESHIADTVVHVTQTNKDTWNAKANGTHTHTKANITDFSHSHVKADITDFPDTSNFMLKTVYDSNADGRVGLADEATSANSVIETRGDTTLMFWVGSQAQYDAIPTKDNSTLYIIK